jgi:MarR family transcriptional regulator, organic hydroperoxide resistance regulator
MAWCPDGNKVDQDIADALTEFFTKVIERSEALAEQHGLPPFAMKAIHRLDGSVTMKELAARMHVDPSFVTMIADTLEKRGLARREPNATDRRLKNLVLTPEGIELKTRLERALLGEMPWCRALDANEKASYLSMTRKMNVVLAEGSTGQPGEVSEKPTAAASPDAA